MRQPLLIADELNHLDGFGVPYPMVTTRDFVMHSGSAKTTRQRVINLSRSYDYQSLGYYTSLLAEARGMPVLPSVETALSLAHKTGYARSLPELDAALNKAVNRDDKALGDVLPETLTVCMGTLTDSRLAAFGRLIFDWYRAPILRVKLSLDLNAGKNRLSIASIKLENFHRLGEADKELFITVLAEQSRSIWRFPKARVAARYSLAVLYDPDETMPPTSVKSLQHFARIAGKVGVEVEPIRKKDDARLAEFDALFIRETTSIRNHTYRFAQRAVAEGIPVIDDPISMTRCTNKVYLWERLAMAGISTPETAVLGRHTNLQQIADTLIFPVVIKVPDGSFSVGVKKADNMAELIDITERFFKESELLLAQQFMPTKFDWRIGVLGGNPLFACQYKMARNHWQIVNHKGDGRAVEGGFQTFALDKLDPLIIDSAIRSAALIGDGFYGIDLKETSTGIAIIEINDNPNLEHGIEDDVGKDKVWLALIEWFVERLRH